MIKYFFILSMFLVSLSATADIEQEFNELLEEFDKGGDKNHSSPKTTKTEKPDSPKVQAVVEVDGKKICVINDVVVEDCDFKSDKNGRFIKTKKSTAQTNSGETNNKKLHSNHSDNVLEHKEEKHDIRDASKIKSQDNIKPKADNSDSIDLKEKDQTFSEKLQDLYQGFKDMFNRPTQEVKVETTLNEDKNIKKKEIDPHETSSGISSQEQVIKEKTSVSEIKPEKIILDNSEGKKADTAVDRQTEPKIKDTQIKQHLVKPEEPKNYEEGKIEKPAHLSNPLVSQALQDEVHRFISEEDADIVSNEFINKHTSFNEGVGSAELNSDATKDSGIKEVKIDEDVENTETKSKQNKKAQNILGKAEKLEKQQIKHNIKNIKPKEKEVDITDEIHRSIERKRAKLYKHYKPLNKKDYRMYKKRGGI